MRRAAFIFAGLLLTSLLVLQLRAQFGGGRFGAAGRLQAEGPYTPPPGSDGGPPIYDGGTAGDEAGTDDGGVAATDASGGCSTGGANPNAPWAALAFAALGLTALGRRRRSGY